MDKEIAFQAAHRAERARAEAAELAEREAAAKAPRITVYLRGNGEFVAHGDVVFMPMTQPMSERYVAICRGAGQFDADNKQWILPEAQWAPVVSALRAAGFWVPLSIYQVREVLPPWGVMGRVLWEEEQCPGAAERCVATAWALSGRGVEVRQPRWTEPVAFPIPVTEVEERGDLLLSLPWGLFTLPAHRAGKGELVTVHSEAGPGLAVARTANEAVPVSLHGRVNEPDLHRGWTVQPSVIDYADGSHSGDLGVYPMDLTAADLHNPLHMAARDVLLVRETARRAAL